MKFCFSSSSLMNWIYFSTKIRTRNIINHSNKFFYDSLHLSLPSARFNNQFARSNWKAIKTVHIFLVHCCRHNSCSYSLHKRNSIDSENFFKERRTVMHSITSNWTLHRCTFIETGKCWQTWKSRRALFWSRNFKGMILKGFYGLLVKFWVCKHFEFAYAQHIASFQLISIVEVQLSWEKAKPASCGK